MSFYTDFASAYERVFPFREATFAFLKDHLGAVASSVLDLGCGTGAYCGRFAAEGKRALGVDLDEAMIRQAALLFPTADFRVLNLARVLDLDERFGAAFCIGNVLPHLDPEGLDRFLDDLGNILDPGSRWCLQTVNWDRILPLETYDFPPLEAGGGLVFHRRYRATSGRGLRFITRLADGETTLFEGEVSLYPLTAETYIRMHRGAGFSLVGHFGDFGGAAFDPAVSGGNILVFEKS